MTETEVFAQFSEGPDDAEPVTGGTGAMPSGGALAVGRQAGPTRGRSPFGGSERPAVSIPIIRMRAAHAAPPERREPGHESAWSRSPVWSPGRAPLPTTFARTPWGHRGYDEPAVDAFVSQVVQDLKAADDQIGDLRAEVDRLHRYIQRQWSAVAVAESVDRPANLPVAGGLVTPAVQAREVLTQAEAMAERRLAQAEARLTQAEARLAEAEQEAAELLDHTGRKVQAKLEDADREATRLIAESDGAAARQLNRVDAIAERMLVEAREDAENRRARAEEDSERLLLLARTRYEDIVVRAHQRADRAAEATLDGFEGPTTTDGGGRLRVELEMKAAYLRTFAKVSRAALQAALDVTAREFDRLLGATAAREQAPADPPLEPLFQEVLMTSAKTNTGSVYQEEASSRRGPRESAVPGLVPWRPPLIESTEVRVVDLRDSVISAEAEKPVTAGRPLSG